MKFNKLYKNKRALTASELIALGMEISNRAKDKGFITGVKVKNNRLTIGNEGNGFTIDVAKRGYNTQYSPHASKKRTRYGSWECHVEFNNLINDVLDHNNIVGKVFNSVFVIRDKDGRKDEEYWHNNKPQYLKERERMGWCRTKGYTK